MGQVTPLTRDSVSTPFPLTPSPSPYPSLPPVLPLTSYSPALPSAALPSPILPLPSLSLLRRVCAPNSHLPLHSSTARAQPECEFGRGARARGDRTQAGLGCIRRRPTHTAGPLHPYITHCPLPNLFPFLTLPTSPPTHESLSFTQLHPCASPTLAPSYCTPFRTSQLPSHLPSSTVLHHSHLLSRSNLLSPLPLPDPSLIPTPTSSPSPHACPCSRHTSIPLMPAHSSRLPSPPPPYLPHLHTFLSATAGGSDAPRLSRGLSKASVSIRHQGGLAAAVGAV